MDFEEEMILLIDKLRFQYNRMWELEIQGFELKEGESVGIFGPNGSGKTTNFNINLGVVVPT